MPKEDRKRKRNRLGVCWVCHTAEGIYSCPKCETVTCSLTCVKKHKKELDCDGVRVRTKYVPLDKLNELHLVSDYRLMEDIERCIETAEKTRESVEASYQSPEVTDTPSTEAEEDTAASRAMSRSKNKKKARQRKPVSRSDISNPEQNVRTEGDNSKGTIVELGKNICGEETSIQKVDGVSGPGTDDKEIDKGRLANAVRRGGKKKQKVLDTLMKAAFNKGTLVSLLPDTFQKHKDNTSYFLAKANCIYWRLSVSFINSNFYTVTINGCAETVILQDLVNDCIKRLKNKEDPLRVYRKLGLKKISVLMAADKLPDSQKKFYVLDTKKSLTENFEGKCIVEFPHLCIALEDCYVVSKPQENMCKSFFDGEDIFPSTGEEDAYEEVEQLKRSERRKNKKHSKCHREELDRESGELTDSSDEDMDDDTTTEDSEEDLYNDGEFRSMYRDLLTSFDVDVSQLH